MSTRMQGVICRTCASISFFFFQAEDGIRDWSVTGVQTCALPIFTMRMPPLRSPIVKTLTGLTGLSARLRLPRLWLRAEALAGRIPCLKIGRKLLFNPDAVEKALADRAAGGEGRRA